MDCEFQWGVSIPMRDGIHLNATAYLPVNRPIPKPCIVTLTPYVSDTYHEMGVHFASRGWPFLAVDVRGRGNSQGEFYPSPQEADDGFDVVEWVARQPYCNGKVAMWGGSYAGYMQWITARAFPPHLATIVPTAAPCRGIDAPMRNNIFFAERLRWLTLTSGRASQTRIYSDSSFWSSLYRRWHASGRSFRDLDTVVGNPSLIFQEWLDHPEPDEYWDAQNPTADEYARLEIPILTITGAYDDDQPGALAHYQRHMSMATPVGRETHYLVIGPWDHAGTRAPVQEFGGINVGPASLVDILGLHEEWYAWALQGGPRPTFLRKRVAFYVMGTEEWRYADSLEATTSRHEILFLDSHGIASDVFGSGFLSPTVGKGTPDSYQYDPRDVQGLEVDAEASSDGRSLIDQKTALALCGRQLVYHSAPFSEDVELCGFFKLVAWISIDCPDTDLYVSVHEVCLDGTSIRLSTDAIRARYRASLRKSELIRTRDPLRYDFERFTFIARRIARGHRLRLIIAPVGRLLEATFAQKNFNAGGIVAEESAADGRAVTVTLFHDEGYPSALHIPLGFSEGDPARRGPNGSTERHGANTPV